MKDLLKYEPETGKFYWLERYHKKLIGVEAGGVDKKGYVKIHIKGKKYQAHRLAWFFSYNIWPDQDLDHINGVRTDNRIVNLRKVTNRENSQNRVVHKQGKLVGCFFDKRDKRWTARIYIQGKNYYLGRFATEAEAHLKYTEALHET